MKIPRKQLHTILRSIRRDEAAMQANSYVVELTVNGVDHSDTLEIEDEESVIGTLEALDLRWWADRIVVDYLLRFANGEALNFPIDLGDLGDPALRDQFERHPALHIVVRRTASNAASLARNTAEGPWIADVRAPGVPDDIRHVAIKRVDARADKVYIVGEDGQSYVDSVSEFLKQWTGRALVETMKIPRKQLHTILKSIRPDETQANAYVVELNVNGVDESSTFEIEEDSEDSVIGTVEAFEPRYWAIDIVVRYLLRFAKGEALNLPLDLGDLGDPALAGESTG
jgi:hypothetical protein